MTQKVLTIDSTILNTFQQCAYKAKLSFKDNVRTVEKAEALESGALMHDMLQVYYSLQLDHFDFETPVWDQIRLSGLRPEGDLKSHQEIKDFAIKCGRFFSTKMNLPVEDSDEVIYHFKEYADYFQHDSWRPLAVEEVGTKLLFEDENLKVLYTFKIDLIAEQGRIIAPFDHKTSKRRSEPTSLSNQFIGYCYGIGTNNLVVNKIGFQKTLTAQQRFQRYILTIDDARKKEWISNTIWWAREIARAEEENNWPLNLTSCDKYSGCMYTPICESDPDNRLYKIERDFKIGEAWDPAQKLEGEKANA